MFLKRYSCFLLIINYAVAQLPNNHSRDSLSNKNYDYLSNAVLKNESGSNRFRLYSQALVSKARANNDYDQLTQAYKTILYKSDREYWHKYADSMLIAAKKTSDNLLIGSAYMTKATIYYSHAENKKALDNFILADRYIANTNDNDAIYKVKFGIAQTKYYLGFYDEAIALFRECMNYFKVENDRAYLNSIHALGKCYNRLGKYDLCTTTNQLGLEESLSLENSEMTSYFVQSEGVNQYGKHNYKEAINKLKATLPNFIGNKDFATETVSYFYLGKCYYELEEQEKAIPYFKKVDTIFEQFHYISPDLRSGYELLIDYYKSNNDKEMQLKYINKLLQVDKILSQNYQYLIKKVVKEYDTHKLLEAKAEIEGTMNFRMIIGIIIFCIMALIIIVLTNRHYKNKRLFGDLMSQDGTKLKATKALADLNKASAQEINPEIELSILKNLEKFEHNKKYLDKEMNLVKMAALLNTNTKYVTKVIAKHRGTGTIDYITTLKIDYIIELLKCENKYRNYTNKALGEEAGFGSTQNFTKAFKAQTGISPTYFIHQLRKALVEESV